MKIAIIGGGPGGLYFAILAKRADPSREITVYERNPRALTYGWGVVFSDEALDSFQNADAASHAAITRSFVHWDTIDTLYNDEHVRCLGHGFCGIARRSLLEHLAQRCLQLGVTIRYESQVLGEDRFCENFDLVVAADGIHSPTRDLHRAHFEPEIALGRNKYIWLGCSRAFDAFKFIVQDTVHGRFVAHAYPYAKDKSTFIVECDPQSWTRAGLDRQSPDAALPSLEALFQSQLQGASLLNHRSQWRSFPRLKNATWHRGNLVLIGDAAHSAHFSIGSGTKMAMQDALALCQATQTLGPAPSLAAVAQSLAQYQDARWVAVAKLQKSATTSQRWFEGMSRYTQLSPLQFTAHLLTRTKQITRENLRARDPDFVARWDRDFLQQSAAQKGSNQPPSPPMFTPFRVGGLELPNRVVVSPMCQYSAVDGVPGDWHAAHLGALARGGAGLVMAEMTAVSPQARITRGCAGLYNDAQMRAWSKIIDLAKSLGPARMGIQLGHAGRKGACTPPWEGDRDLGVEGWPLIAPSPLRYDAQKAQPRAFDPQDLPALIEAYVQAARRADQAGFDLLELHMAHGYLLGSCLSPLTNLRKDAYGGDLAGRAKLPMEILDAVRAVWPSTKALSVRISATDWAPGGLSREDRLALATLLKARGCDLLDVSSGQTVAEQRPEYGRMYQTRFADELRHLVDIPTMAVGAITSWDQVNTIIATGRADLCALARPHLQDPHFTLRAAIEQGHRPDHWPRPYDAVAPGER